jgi:hypothetical protein
MSRTLTNIFIIAMIFLALAILGGLVWANTVYVRAYPLEKDFLVPWLGARTFLQYGDSPYGEPATQRAQIVYYGRLATEDEDPLQLWLPFPVELFYFPFALVTDYALARAIWMTCLEIALVALALLSLRLTGWEPARTLLPIVLLFSLFWVYGAFSLAGGSGIGFLALAMVGFLLALREERDELAGMLLLLSLSAPRMTGVFLFFILWWIFYHRRWRVVWGFLMGLLLLLALSFLFLPDWFLSFLKGLLPYISNNPGLSLTSILASWSPVAGPRLGWVISAGLLLVLFIEWGNTLRKDFRQFLWTVSLTLAATPLLGIPMLLKEYVFLFIPLALFLSILAERWSRPRRWGVAGIVLIVILAGSWLLTLKLSAANAYAALADSLFLLLPVLLIFGLYWMRWWFIHPRRTGLQSTA